MKDRSDHNNEWLKALRHKLFDYKEPVDKDLWNQLAGELQDLEPVAPRPLWIRRHLWSVAATIAALIVGSLFLYNNIEKTTNINGPKTAYIKTNDRKIADKTSVSSTLLAVNQNCKTNSQMLTTDAQQSSVNNPKLIADVQQPIAKSQKLTTANSQEATIDNKQQIADIQESKANSQESTADNQKPTAKNQKSKVRSQQQKAKSQQLTADNQLSYGMKVGMEGFSSTGSMGTDMAYAGAISNIYSTLSSPDMTLRAMYSDYKFSHQQPISIAFVIEKPILDKLSLESGVVYTLLISKAKSDFSNETHRQYIHYVGIPLKGNYRLLTNRDYALYVTAGGMIEKCIYGVLKGNKLPTSNYQASVNAGLGAQYHLTKRLNLFGEVGAVYYFDNKSMIQTIRTKSPVNLNLEIGIRFSH